MSSAPAPLPTNDLERLFHEHQGRLMQKWAHYFGVYDEHVSRFRGTDVTIVEFGVNHGGSLQLWRKYFGPKARIYGVDINPHCKSLEEDGVEIFIGDQADRGFLRSIAQRVPRIDILIDDGGHTMAQQIATFEELFLSQADRGATARRGPTASLAALAAQVVEFHEALIEEAGLTVRIEGDAQAAVDEPLVKRALANLLGNAIRFAQRGSCVAVCIAPDAAEQVRVEVRNAGEPIAPQHLERLFDRFFRVDAARPDSQSHHGLGLAIVAAIARMHAGRPLAASEGGSTRVGFTLVAH